MKDSAARSKLDKTPALSRSDTECGDPITLISPHHLCHPRQSHPLFEGRKRGTAKGRALWRGP